MALELLSPAGSPEALRAAVQSGCGAVYLGWGNFNARRSAKNFSDEEFADAIRYCHLRGVRVFLTLNTLLTDVEDLPRINELAQSLQELKANGQLTKIKAVIGATQCETLDDVFDRIEKLPQYCFETKIRDKDALVRDELEFVLGGRDADLIYKHLNREAYAEDVLKQYGAEITPYGMVNREDFGPLHEPIPEQQQEQTQEPQMGM